MIDNNEYTVFVYGTLRRGESNSSLLDNSEYIGTDRVNGFILRNLGEYPMAFERSGDKSEIIIEIYKIDEITLHQLDMLEEYIEGHESSLYHRKKVLSISGLSGYIYFGKDENKYLSYDVIPGGDWKKSDYSCRSF